MYYALGLFLVWVYGLGIVVAAAGNSFPVNGYTLDRSGVFGWLFQPFTAAALPMFLGFMFVWLEIRHLWRRAWSRRRSIPR